MICLKWIHSIRKHYYWGLEIRSLLLSLQNFFLKFLTIMLFLKMQFLSPMVSLTPYLSNLIVYYFDQKISAFLSWIWEQGLEFAFIAHYQFVLDLQKHAFSANYLENSKISKYHLAIHMESPYSLSFKKYLVMICYSLLQNWYLKDHYLRLEYQFLSQSYCPSQPNSLKPYQISWSLLRWLFPVLSDPLDFGLQLQYFQETPANFTHAI